MPLKSINQLIINMMRKNPLIHAFSKIISAKSLQIVYAEIWSQNTEFIFHVDPHCDVHTSTNDVQEEIDYTKL